MPGSNLFGAKAPSTNGAPGKNLFGSLTSTTKPLFGSVSGPSFGAMTAPKSGKTISGLSYEDKNPQVRGFQVPESSPTFGSSTRSDVVDLLSDDDEDLSQETSSPIPTSSKARPAQSALPSANFAKPLEKPTSSIFGTAPQANGRGSIFSNGGPAFGASKTLATEKPQTSGAPSSFKLTAFTTSGNSLFGQPKDLTQQNGVTFPRLNSASTSFFNPVKPQVPESSGFPKPKQPIASFAAPLNKSTLSRVNKGFEVPSSDFELDSYPGPLIETDDFVFSQNNKELSPALDSSSPGRKRSHDDVFQSDWMASVTKSKSIQKQPNSDILAIAEDFAAKCKPAVSFEPGSIIVRTDHQVSAIHRAHSSDLKVSETVVRLNNLWLEAVDEEADPPSQTRQRISTGIDSALAKAQMLASLLLSVRHPPAVKTQHDPSASLHRSLNSFTKTIHPRKYDGNSPSSVPRACLDWLEQHRDTIKEQFYELQHYEHNATAHPQFWETINATLIRGRFEEVIRVMKQADFRYAHSAIEDGAANIGYEGTRLLNVQKVVNAAVSLLQESPSLHGDWDMQDQPWQDYRASVKESLDNLSRFAEGRIIEPANFRETFSASHFGMSTASAGSHSISQAARSAQSLVPWYVYTPLKEMYGILLGSSSEIVANAFDWVEATVFLTVWWDGEDTDVRLDKSVSHKLKKSHRSSQKRHTAGSDGSIASYADRMTTAFHQISEEDSDEDNFQVDSMNDLELGLAALFEGSHETAVRLLRSWSMTIASAVVEIGSEAGWLHLTKNNRGYGFDDDDLMVLEYNQSQTRKTDLTRDSILLEYTERLFKRGVLAEDAGVDGEGKHMGPLEGWEVGLRVLGRVHDHQLVADKVPGLLSDLDLTVSRHRVNKVIRTCDSFGFEEQAREVSLVSINPSTP